MKKIYVKKALFWLARFLHLNIFISVIAFIILASWGIPFSLLSPIGNLIFSPLLYLFLFISSLVFFTQVIGIPNTPLIAALEKTSSLWIKMTSQASTKALIGIRQPSLWSIVIISAIILAILHIKNSTLFYRLMLFSVLGVAIIGIDRSTHPSYQHLEIPCHNTYVTLINNQRKTIVIDPGAIGKRMSAQSWINYTLIPTLVTKTGSPHIDTLILLDINSVLFNAITTLAQKISIKTIYLPDWQGELPPIWQHTYATLLATTSATGTQLHFFGTQTTSITTASTTITATPYATRSKKGIRIPQVALTEKNALYNKPAIQNIRQPRRPKKHN